MKYYISFISGPSVADPEWIINFFARATDGSTPFREFSSDKGFFNSSAAGFSDKWVRRFIMLALWRAEKVIKRGVQ